MSTITVQTTVRADPEKVWECWTDPAHIVHWNAASDDWECPEAHNDPVEEGRFRYVMRARDGSRSFDFGGMYLQVEEGKMMEYEIDDGRKVTVIFEPSDEGVQIIETFVPEMENPLELQRAGWQSILDHFKRYVETQ